MSISTRGYKTFDHTADIGLEIWGETFNAVFEEAGKALFSLIVESGEIVPRETFAIELSAESGEELFLKWLKELLYVFETKKMVLSEFNILNLEPCPSVTIESGNEDAGAVMTTNKFSSVSHGWVLVAKVGGERLDPAIHALGKEVKAITHHLYEFKKTNNSFQARVILDI